MTQQMTDAERSEFKRLLQLAAKACVAQED